MAGTTGDEPDVRDVPKPVDVRGALEEALEKLSAIDGKRALIGGVAMAMYGVERFTKDVDLAVTVAQTGLAESQLEIMDRRPLRIGGVSFVTHSGVRVDLIDRRFEYRALFEEAIDTAAIEGPRARAGEREVPVVTLPHLVALKMAAGRAKDEHDLDALLRKSDLDYVRARSIVKKHLGDFAARYLDRLARATGRGDVPADYDDANPYEA